MHPYVLADMSDRRLEDYHRRAEHARLAAAARRASGSIHRVGPLRARVGGLLVSLGTAVAGTRAPAHTARLRGAR